MEKITLVKHREHWKHEFNKERDLLASALGSLFFKIHHVGSTAVPDLLAKPVIDIAVELTAFPASQTTILLLAASGYQCMGEAGVSGRLWLIKGSPRQFNMHLCAMGSDVVKNQILFRDRLRCDESLRRRYERIKIENLDGKAVDDAGYAYSKSVLIRSIVKQEKTSTDSR